MASTINATPTSSGLISTADNSGVLALQTGGTTAVTVDGSQNVGIGTSSPTQPLHISKPQGSALIQSTTNTNSVYLGFVNGGGTSYVGVDTSTGSVFSSGVYGMTLFNSANSATTFFTNATERMRLDSSGNLLVGKTASNTGTVGFQFILADNKLAVGAASGASAFFNRNTDDGAVVQFARSGSVVGSVSVTASATAYNTSSDYRLKENILPMTGALATVAQLKPVTYKWKSTGENGQGFIAHELQALVPDCVIGEKDGMRTEQYEISPAIPATIDEEGNELTPAVEAVMGEREVPDYQGIDTSFLVATLTAAIQELNAKVDAQAITIAELQARLPAENT